MPVGKTMTITFDNSVKKQVLSILGMKTNRAGYIVSSKTGQEVLSFEGEHVRLREFAGVYKGLVFKSDLMSLMKVADRIKHV